VVGFTINIPRSRKDSLDLVSSFLADSTMSSSNAPTLTSHLLSLQTTPSYASATQHPFLAAAGADTLPVDRLAFWLAQDYIYASSYPALLGRLLMSAPRGEATRPALALIADALSNIVREARFFEDVARRYKMQLSGWKERKATRDYTAEMVRATSGSFEDGMIFLWAMEKVGPRFFACVCLLADSKWCLGLFRRVDFRSITPQ
jgi:formylaminopyrimidine deformylase / aminopyrimidine aminohydrolase